METIGAYDAKTHLPHLLKRAATGERTTITRHGVPVAMLGPVDTNERSNVADTIARIRAFGARHPRGNLDIEKMIEVGRD